MRPSLLLFGAAPRPPLSMLLHFLCQHVNEHFCRPCGGIAARISAALALFIISFIPPPAARSGAGALSPHLSLGPCGEYRSRTDDLLLAKQAL